MMLTEVKTNLERTIAGKEVLLKEKTEMVWFESTSEIVSNRATIEFLKVNVDELKRILVDVEACMVETKALQDRVTELGWQVNPDRMGQ